MDNNGPSTLVMTVSFGHLSKYIIESAPHHQGRVQLWKLGERIILGGGTNQEFQSLHHLIHHSRFAFRFFIDTRFVFRFFIDWFVS